MAVNALTHHVAAKLSEVIACGKTPIRHLRCNSYRWRPTVLLHNAVLHLSVDVALLLEYLSPVLVVGQVWTSTRKRLKTTTLVGATLRARRCEYRAQHLLRSQG